MHAVFSIKPDDLPRQARDKRIRRTQRNGACGFLLHVQELISALLRPVQMYNSGDLHRPDDAPYPMSVSWPGAQPVSGTSNNYSIHYLGQYPIAEMQCWDHHLVRNPPVAQFLCCAAVSFLRLEPIVCQDRLGTNARKPQQKQRRAFSQTRPWHNETPAQLAGRFFCEPMPLEATADVCQCHLLRPSNESAREIDPHFRGKYEASCHSDEICIAKPSSRFIRTQRIAPPEQVLIYTALVAMASKNDTLSMAELYLPTLRTFAQYVEQNGRDPVLQLYTVRIMQTKRFFLFQSFACLS